MVNVQQAYRASDICLAAQTTSACEERVYSVVPPDSNRGKKGNFLSAESAQSASNFGT